MALGASNVASYMPGNLPNWPIKCLVVKDKDRLSSFQSTCHWGLMLRPVLPEAVRRACVGHAQARDAHKVLGT